MGSKICTRCNVEKPLSEYHNRAQTKDGKHYACKSCRKEETAARGPQIAKYNKQYHKEKYLTVKKKHALNYKYGMSMEEYNALLTKQNGTCAICKLPDTKMLSVDHNHLTGQIRGLLCDPCNRGLGFFGDSPTRLEAAYHYLQERGNYGN
jgi:hypothetical protein